MPLSMVVYELTERTMNMAMGGTESFGKNAKALDKAHVSDGQKPAFEYNEAEYDKFERFLERVAIKIAPIPEDSLEKVGKEFLTELYGPVEFPDALTRFAGRALEAYRSGNAAKGKANTEQVYVGLKKMYPKTFDQYMTDMNVAVSDLRGIANGKESDEPPEAAE